MNQIDSENSQSASYDRQQNIFWDVSSNSNSTEEKLEEQGKQDIRRCYGGG